jgi:nucleotide-binding universal stress UspA family protein
MEYQSILVAVDGSKEAEYAFHKSIAIAKRNKDAQLTIVNVLNTQAFEVYERSVVGHAEQVAQELVDGYKSQAEAEGVSNVIAKLQYGGSPKTVITGEVAQSVDADLIVCGATGLNAVERFITGSVSEAIVRSARCDVLVIRRPA